MREERPSWLYPFFGAELLSSRARLRDFYGHILRRDGPDGAADLAVIKPDRFAGADAIEKFRKRSADARRASQLLFLVVLRGLVGIERPREDERVTDIETERLGL